MTVLLHVVLLTTRETRRGSEGGICREILRALGLVLLRNMPNTDSSLVFFIHRRKEASQSEWSPGESNVLGIRAMARFRSASPLRKPKVAMICILADKLPYSND